MKITHQSEKMINMFSKWISLRGVSRTTSISFLPSFRQTSADLDMSSSPRPILTAASVFILQGMMNMPSCTKEPDDGGAAKSELEYE